MNKTPLTDLHTMAAMLADNAWVIAVSAIIFGVNRPMEYRPEEFAVSAVDRGGRWSVADLKLERSVKVKSAGQTLRNGKVQLRSVLSSGS
ncbi:MAG: hypothetical protein SF069_10990 [Phycisphaerae bacterium]|nr:hypothetical protein [Phycisphaerae bacterium]